MRILLVVHQFPPERLGGTEVYTLELARELAARGHQAAVFHRAPGPRGLVPAEWDRVPVYRASGGPMTPLSVFRATFGEPTLEGAFLQALDQAKPDLIHIQHLMGLPVSIVEHIRQREIPVVLTLHDYWFMCANAQLLTNTDARLCDGPRLGGLNCGRCALARAGVPWLWPVAPGLVPVFLWRRQLLRHVLEVVDHLIAPSRFLAERMVQWGAPGDRMSHVANGLDTHGVQPRTGGREGPARFAFIGGLAPQKGVHTLVEAFNQLGSEAKLEIYGDLDQFPDYVRQLRAAARSPQISFGGRLDRAGVWQVLSEIDALLMPSLWYENAPVVIQEAFAAGVPVVASQLGAMTEWVRHEEDGLLVPPGDVPAWRATVARLSENPDLLTRLALNTPRPMTISEHVERILELYQRVAGDGRRSP
jgi:glycosyltransferase involved in cell wall biosynthesis